MSGALAAPDWNRRVLRLAVPIILSNASVPLLGAVDTAVMGHLPDPAYIGAVAVGAMIFSFLYWGFGFLRMGTTGFTAQAFGAEDAEEMRATLARPVLLGLLIGLCLIALQALIAPAAFYFIDDRYCRQQGFRIRMLRILQNRRHRTLLHDSTEIHYRHLVRQISHDRQIVGNEQVT